MKDDFKNAMTLLVLRRLTKRLYLSSYLLIQKVVQDKHRRSTLIASFFAHLSN